MDLLVFAPHPDDAEIGLGGTMARHAADGYTVAIVELTAGELSTNGTPAERQKEAAAAAALLGVSHRENLGWPDGGIATTPDLVRSAVEAIRRHRPKTIAVPHWQDRHPDHVRASDVLTSAAFASGLRRYAADGEPWRADWVCYYFINDSVAPSFVVDVSAHYATKWAALACYRSQFTAPGTASGGVPTTAALPGGAAFPDDGAVPTRLTAPTFRALIESRDAQFGALAGVAFAEGVVVREPVQRTSLLKQAR